MDVYWNLVNTVYATVGITSTNGAVTLPADVQFVEGTNTFAVTLNTNGIFMLTATNMTDINIASSTVAVTAYPVLASAGTWKTLPIVYAQTPDTNGWSTVPVASVIKSQGFASWDIKQVKMCNDATNLCFVKDAAPRTKSLDGSCPQGMHGRSLAPCNLAV